MKISDFRVEPDLVARRLRVAWRIVPDVGETLADAPRLVLRRKTRDWEFGPAIVPDPYLVYDSAAFPGAPGPGIAILDLDDREERDGADRILIEGISIAQVPPGIEWRRRIHATRFAADGHPVERRVEIVDGGAEPLSLDPATNYYYELSGVDVRLRAAAAPSSPFGMNRSLYDMLPSVHRLRDVSRRVASSESATIPEASVGQTGGTMVAGQLRRFLDPFGAALDAMRSSADGLWQLRDIDRVEARHLPLIAEWIGWRLGDADAVPMARNELKSAPGLFKALGSVTSYRAIVERYTGWTTRVAEFAQHIARSNDPPRPQVFASVQVGGAWRSPLDIAATLGFGAGNDDAAGLAALPAVLTGAAGPYAIFPGAELTIAVDGGAPITVRFADSDFANPSAVTAAELAARIDAATTEIAASDAAGRLRLSSRGTGTDARLTIVHNDAALLTLSGAAPDAAAAVLDGDGRIHLIVRDAPPTADPAARTAPTGPDAGAGLFVKSFAYGRWHGAMRLPVPPGAAFPAAARLGDGSILIAWIEHAATPDARIGMATARARPATPARLVGRKPMPLVLFDGGRLRLRTPAGTVDFIANAADYADITRATAAEFVAAFNAQVPSVRASAGADGSVVLESVATGPQARLAIDLAGSTISRRLGLADLSAAQGHWDPTLDLLRLPGMAAGSFATGLAACATPGGGIRLAWSSFGDSGWRIEGAATLGDISLIATGAGLAVRAGSGAVQTIGTAQGAPSNRIRQAQIDGHGQLWIATDAGLARRRADASWQTITAAGGLSSNDVRRIAFAPDGTLWAATGGGVTAIAPGMPPQRFALVEGVPSLDVRALAFDRSGGVWAATAAGLARRDGGGGWTVFGASDGVPDADIRDVAIDDGGILWIATAAGLARRDVAGEIAVVETPAALGIDLRGVAAAGDIVWIASASGAWRLRDGVWRGWTMFEGVGPAVAVSADADGAWVATAAGAVRIERDMPRALTTVDGLPSNAVATVSAGQSRRMVLVDAPAARDPALLLEANGRQLLAWSHADVNDQAADQRRIRLRRFDPASGSWLATVDATAPPPGGRAADSQPALLATGGGARLFFTTDRGGAPGLAEASVSAALVTGAVTPILPGAVHRSAATPLVLPAGMGLMLLHRADQSIVAGQVSPVLAGAATGTGGPAMIAATMQRRCGTTTARSNDAARNGRRKRWDDQISYTPHRPVLDGEMPIAPDEFYTRGTLGLYISRGTRGRPLTGENAVRLQQLLREFLPINMRAVLILDAGTPEELVFPGDFITDSFVDDMNFIERIGLPRDSTRALLPQWVVLRTNRAGDVSADPVNLTTLRRRSFFEPPQ